MRPRLYIARWLVALGLFGCTMLVHAVPARSFVAGSYLECFNNARSDETAAKYMTLPGPPNGATVPAGTPVAFSGEFSVPLTFSVASSPSLLANPDIDSGMGSLQPGTSLYSFTSTTATSEPRTIYWTASFTLTPEKCQTPETFTTPVRTLTVTSSSAEEEAAAKKLREEEAQRKAASEPKVSRDGFPTVVCGQTLDSGAAAPVIQRISPGRRYVLHGSLEPGLRQPRILQFGSSCTEGVKIKIKPAGILTIDSVAWTADHTISAIALNAERHGIARITVTWPHGHSSVITVRVEGVILTV